MKRIEFVLCLFFISTVSFAQKEIAPTKNLDAYIGTWMYQSNDTIFKIVLKKGYAEDQHMIINGLMGGYFLSVKGIIVENYFSIRDTIWHLDKKRKLKIFLSGLQTMLPVWTTLILIESEFYFTTNGRSTSAEKGY